MAFRIRVSKFRHVYGEVHRKDKCFESIRLTRNAHDSNFCAVNPKYLAVVTEASGGGAFIVLPVNRTGRIDVNAPKVCGHASNVLDIKWNPFRDDVIASGSEDNTVKIWQIPAGGLMTNLTEWQVDLHGHGRRVVYIDWHPTAEGIILSAGLDYKCMIWNVETAEPVNVISCHHDNIQSISWNRDGSLFCTTCKDKHLRVIDPRAGTCVVDVANTFRGIRPMKSVYLGDSSKVFCSGFGTLGEREIAVWDIRNTSTEFVRRPVDSSNGILMPYYDHDSKMVFLAGKGDGNIRYYELTDNNLHYLNSYGTSSPQRGLGVMPKRGCDTSKCEIMRFYKLHAAKDLVEPISMIVPRKSNHFHSDIYPPTASAIPSLNADEWISGQNRDPILMSMQDFSIVSSPGVTPSRPLQHPDGQINQTPTITTYKAVNAGNQSNSSKGSKPLERPEVTKLPASLQNIKRLSTSEDIVTLTPAPTIQAKSLPGGKKPQSSKPDTTEKQPDVVEPQTDKEKAFVNSKIAAFENKGNNASTEVTSPTRKRTLRSWSSGQTNDPPPDVIANGFKSSQEPPTENSHSALKLETAAKFFEHKDIEIIDIKPETRTPSNQKQGARESTPALSGTSRVHVKKVWSPMQPPDPPVPTAHSSNAPSTDPELRRAYFQQVEELRCLKEQLALKDKRIHQLEDEVATLRGTGAHSQGTKTKKSGDSHC